MKKIRVMKKWTKKEKAAMKELVMLARQMIPVIRQLGENEHLDVALFAEDGYLNLFLEGTHISYTEWEKDDDGRALYFKNGVSSMGGLL